MKTKSALAIAIIVPAVFASGAIAATKTAPTKSTTTSKAAGTSVTTTKTATKTATKAPEVTATLDRTSYNSDATMTLTVNENIWAKDSLSVADSSGTAWTRKSATTTTTVFTAKAVKAGTVTVTLTRTWDKASATAKASYTVVTSTPLPPPPSPTPTPPPPSPTPTPPPPSPSPTTPVFAGQVAGKFYLGMSCGVICPEKESALGQSYGVHRTYKQWNNWSGVAKEIQADHAAGRLPWVSFKPPLAGAEGWSAVASGSYDTDLKALATTLKANDDKPVLITFHHEPSNDGTEDEGKLWAAAYVHIHDLLKAEGALGPNVSDPPILQDWIFNPTNKTQDPINWATNAVLERAPFMGIDMYQNSSGEGYSVRIPRIIDWMAARGFPNKMVGIGETGSTASFDISADKWLNDSLSWAANNTDKVGVVSYFNSTANSDADVYWPLDESAEKMSVFKSWLNNNATID